MQEEGISPPLELELQGVVKCGCWEGSTGPLGEEELLATELSLQSLDFTFLASIQVSWPGIMI